ncbi:MAG: T9SS type A sorting domain-containing protein [Bacteroidota bacterium]
MKVFQLILFLLMIPMLNFKAQSIEQNVIGSAGENFINSLAELSFTIGELSIQTESANAAILSQGFHQSSLNITEVTDVGVQSEIDVFPNPTQDNLIIQFHGFINEERNIEIFDLIGQKVYGKVLRSTENQLKVSLNHLKAGHYILSIAARKGDILNTYRIVKLN